MANKIFYLFRLIGHWVLQIDIRKDSEVWTKRLAFVMIMLIGFSWFGGVSAQSGGSNGGCLGATLTVGNSVNANFPGVGNNANSFSQIGNLVGGSVASGLTILTGVCPQSATQNSQIYQNLPEDMKNGGLTGFAFNETYALFEKLPSISIPQHFAKHWLPKDLYNNTVYAQAGSDVTAYDQLVSGGLDKVWAVVFNISMTAFIIVIMIAGFMVMFRAKLGQGTVSVGNAISRVILGVVLALSSFSIGAIVIDLGKWLTRVVRELVFIQGLYGGSNGVVDIEGPISLAVNAFSSYGGTIGSTTDVTTSIVNIIWTLFWGGTPVLSGLVNILFMAIIAVMIFTTSFRIYFKLLSLYIKLVVSTMFGPLYALIGSIPGREATITNWFKDMVADSVSISVIYFFVNLAVYFMKKNIDFMSFTTANTVSLSGGVSPVGGMNVSVLMGLMIFLMAASADDFIKERFAVKESAALRKEADAGVATIQSHGMWGYNKAVGK